MPTHARDRAAMDDPQSVLYPKGYALLAKLAIRVRALVACV